MPVVSQVSMPTLFLSGLLSAFTIYDTYEQAQAAAVALSSSNASAPVYTARVLEHTVGGNGGRTNMIPNGSPPYVVQLASGATVNVRDTARVNAVATSQSNAGATAFVARVFQSCVGP